MLSYFVGTTSISPSTSAVNYNSPVVTGAGSWSATIDGPAVLPHPIVLDRLRMNITTAPGVGKSYTYTIVKNGSDTALTCTISDTNISAQDLTNTVSFDRGDTIALKVTPTGTPTAQGISAWNIRQSGDQLFAVVGSKSTLVNSATDYMFPQGRVVSGATEALYRGIVPSNGVIKNLTIDLAGTPGAGTSYAFTIYKNGSATGLTCTVANTATTASDTTNTVSIAAGDTISLEVIPTGTPTGRRAAIAVSFAPTVDGESWLSLINATGGPNVNTTRYEQPMADGANGFSATEANRVLRLGATTAKGMYVVLSAAPGSGKSWGMTMRNELASSAATFTIANTATTGNVTGVSVQIVEDARIAFEAAPTGVPAVTLAKCAILLFTPPIGRRMMVSQAVNRASTY